VDAVFENYAVTHVFPHIGARTMVLNARRLYGAAETDHRILLAIEDITDKQKDAEGVIDD
jgi:hypothetical protein